MNKIFGFLIGSILAAILLLALPIGCKSVRKSQNEKFETAMVKKSDSSSSKSYSYVDTTKTDSSTEITETTYTADSIDYYTYNPTGYNFLVDTTTLAIRSRSKVIKAKGVKIVTTTIKQAATKAKGVTIKEDVKQADIKIDSGFAKRELSKETVKKPSIYMGIGLVFGIAILIGLIWVIVWVYRRKKAAAKAAIEAAGKIL